MADTPTSAATLRAKHAQPPVDPHLNLPKGVRDAGKRAEIIQQSLIGEAEPSVLTAPPEGQGPANGQAPTPPSPPTAEVAPPPQAQPALPPVAPSHTPQPAAAPPLPVAPVPPDPDANVP